MPKQSLQEQLEAALVEKKIAELTLMIAASKTTELRHRINAAVYEQRADTFSKLRADQFTHWADEQERNQALLVDEIVSIRGG